MRASLWIIALFLSSSLCSISAMAADTAPATEVALEQINAAPEHDKKDCPVVQGKKECMHKKDEPCRYGKDDNYKSKSPDKCDYKKQG